MIKGNIIGPNNVPFFIFGLSDGNIQRMKAGQPILSSLESFGVEHPGQVVIMCGPTEQAIVDDLVKHSLITDQTVIHRDPKMDAIDAIPRQTDKLLVATVGYPRSGKSTWAKSQAYPIVNPDSIRLAIHGQRFIGAAEPFVWATAKAMVSALFKAGHSTVVLDACNNTHARRDEWRSKEWDLVFKVINTPAEVCIERAQRENDQEIILVIERMAAGHEPLGEEEVEWP